MREYTEIPGNLDLRGPFTFSGDLRITHEVPGPGPWVISTTMRPSRRQKLQEWLRDSGYEVDLRPAVAGAARRLDVRLDGLPPADAPEAVLAVEGRFDVDARTTVRGHVRAGGDAVLESRARLVGSLRAEGRIRIGHLAEVSGEVFTPQRLHLGAFAEVAGSIDASHVETVPPDEFDDVAAGLTAASRARDSVPGPDPAAKAPGAPAPKPKLEPHGPLVAYDASIGPPPQRPDSVPPGPRGMTAAQFVLPADFKMNGVVELDGDVFLAASGHGREERFVDIDVPVRHAENIIEVLNELGIRVERADEGPRIGRSDSARVKLDLDHVQRAQQSGGPSENTLLVRGSVEIEASAHVKFNIHAHGDIIVGDRAWVDGSTVAEGGLHLGDGCFVKGEATSVEDVRFGRGARAGSVTTQGHVYVAERPPAEMLRSITGRAILDAEP